MPILGVVASGISGNLDASAYFPIATTTLATSAATFSFTSIPSTYTHLQIRFSAQTSRNYAFDDAKLQLNGDTGNNYSHHRFYGDGQGNNGVSNVASTNSIYGPFLGAAGSQSNAFGSTIIDILDYANTSKYKTVRIITGQNSNGASTGSGISSFISGLWMNTNAITSILIRGDSALNISAKSVFTLYGIKG